MTSRCARAALFVCLLLAPVWAAAADDTLASAYSAILRGDYVAGHAAVERALESGPTQEAARVRDWLQSYEQIITSRKELKEKTFEWNVAHAREAMAEGKNYLALSFATQASAYTDDEVGFSREHWVGELTQRCKAEAREHAAAGHWSKALSFYVLLERIHEDDKELTKLKDQASQRVRITLLYEDEEAMNKQIEGVNRKLLRSAVRLINSKYHEDPNFREAAEGGIDNLLALCETEELHEYLDGLANPMLRNHFIKKLKDLRADLLYSETGDYQDLLRLFNQIADANRLSIDVPEGLLVVEFLEGVHLKLDEYTQVIWPADVKDFRKMLMGDFEGIGIQLGLDERSNRLKVITPLENSPALEAGIQPDDLIMAVDGKSTKGWTTQDAVENIMGPAGSKVVLTIFRPETGQDLAFELSRRQIVLTTVRGIHRIPGTSDEWDYMLDKEAGIAYIRLTDFHPDSGLEFSRSLSQARAQGMKGLVLDMRHNSGGVLDVAIDIISNFLDEEEIVSTRGRIERDQQRAHGRGLYRDLPLVVLVNAGSASATEILSGALQDHHRAIVLGDRTYGKGVVQHVLPLADDAQLKVTIAHYYLPSGRSPQRMPDSDGWGVEPDVQLKLTPKEFRRVLEQQRDCYIIRNEHAGDNKVLSAEEQEKRLAALKIQDEEEDGDEPPLLSDADIELLESDPFEAADTDPQLESALLMLRVKLAANAPWPRKLASASPQDSQEH